MTEKKTVKITCNLSGYSQGIQRDYYKKKIDQYGSEENLLKFYVQNKIIGMINKGYKLLDISKLLGFELDESKEEYYNELTDFHTKNNKLELLPTPQQDKNSNTFSKTDDDVLEFINGWKNYKKCAI